MGTCSSKGRIEKSVESPSGSPARPRSNNVKVPNTSSTLPDARHEYSTVADHPLPEPKDNKDDEDDDHPFFPHEAETPEVLSARSSTDNGKSNTDGKAHTSAAFESSEEDSTFKQLQMSAHPGSLPDDYHDALDEFGKSLTDSRFLISENNPLHESKSAKNEARPFTSRSFTERIPSEKSLEESKQEPLHSAAAPSKEAKDLAKVFATREESYRSTATIAAPAEVGNISTRDTTEATEAVASIQGEDKVSEITPAIETATELAAITSSAVKDKETLGKYAQKPKSTNADEQPSVSIPDLTEKGERSETTPATSPATDIAANLPTTDSKETTESTVETEKCYEESHATKEEDVANDTTTEDVRFIKLGCNDIENRDSRGKNNSDEQRDISYIKVCREPAMAQTPNAALEVVESFPTKDDAMLAEQILPLEESHIKIITAPATDETIEPDILNTYQVIHNARIGGPESSHVENVIMTKSRSIDQQEIVLCPAMEDQQEESHQNPDTVTATTVVGMLPTKENEQTAYQTVSINKQQKGNNRALASDVSTERLVLQINAATEDKGMEHESSNKGNVEKTESTVDNDQQFTLSPALEGQNEKSQATPCINEVKDREMLNTRNNTWEADPTITLELLHDVLDPTATDATMVVDATLLNTTAQGKFIYIESIEVVKAEESIEVVKAEETASINDEKKQDPPPTMEEQGEEPNPLPATNVETEIANVPMMDKTNTTPQTVEHHKLSCTTTTNAIKEDFLANNVAAETVLGVDYDCRDIKNEQKNKNRDVDEQLNLSCPSLKEKYEESDTAQPTISALEVIETFNAKDNTVELKQIILQEELRKEFNTTSVIEATMEATNEEKEDAKVKQLKSSGVQDLKDPESRSTDQQETLSYPSLVYQTEESHRIPVIDPITKIDRMLPTNNDAQTTDFTITAGKKHKESSRAPDANVKTKEDDLLINVAREDKCSEHERNNEKNAERTENTNAEQQSTLSPALEEQYEDSQTCSDINAAKEVRHTVHRKKNAWEEDLMIASEEPHDHSHMAVIEIKIVADNIAINGAAKDEAMKLESNDVEEAQEPGSLSVNKEQLHSPPAKEEQGQETVPALDTDGVTKIAESLATITGTHICGIQDLKQPESKSIDQQETIPYPSLVDQTEESHRNPVIVPVTKVDEMFPTNNEALTTDLTITTNEKHGESSRTPDANVSTEEDALLTNAAREAKGLEHERNMNENAERAESTNVEQQSTLSPALEEHEDPRTRSDINVVKEIPETVHGKENAWEADSMMLSEELHDQSHTAATESKMEEDASAINEVEKDEATALERNKVDNAQETTSLCVKKEQLHSPPAIEEVEHSQETDPILDTEGVTEIVEGIDTINGIMDVQDLKEPESRSLDQQETISYPSLVYQTEESHRSPVIPVTEVDGMVPTNNKAQTTDEKHKESSRAPDANVRTKEDALLINAAREAKGLEHGRNNDENAERTESTNAEQQSTFSPALGEQHEDSQTCSNINAANEIPESVHRMENVWEADPVIPSEELHDQSHTATTETKLEQDAIAINGVEKSEASQLESNNVENAQESVSLCVNKEQSHSPPAVEEQGQETVPVLDTDGVTKIVESLATITGTHISGIQDLKQPKSRSIDQQETITYPSSEEQTEESHINPVIVPVTKVDGMFLTNNEAQTADLTITTDENHEESSRAPDANVSIEEDALLVNAAREAKGLEHERNMDENAEKGESTNVEQQSTLSLDLEEHEDSWTCSDINAVKEIPETVHRKENAWEADPMILSEELHDQSHTATTETNMEEDTTEIQSNEVENAQEPTSLCVNMEQLHSPPAIEEQDQKTDPVLDTGETGIVESLDTINGTHIMDVQDIKEAESRSLDQQETISYPPLVYQTEESRRSPVIVPVTEVDGMFPTNNKARTTDLLTTTDEKNKESSRAPDAKVRTEEDAILINAVREAKGLEHGKNNDENAERTESTNVEQQSTLSPALEIPESVSRKENAWEVDPVIPSEELHDQSHTAATETKLEKDAFAINGVEKGEDLELESNNVENAQEPIRLCVKKEQSHSPPVIEEQGQETVPALETDGVTKILESLATITGTHISSIQDLEQPERSSIDQQETISYPSLVDQTEESQRSPVIVPITKVDGMFPTNNEAQTTDLTITKDENHEESSRAPDANVRTEEDALLINAAREAKGLEHERNMDENAERVESTNVEQQSTLSPALEEEHEDPLTCSDINAVKEIPETVHRKEKTWEADPMILSELHDQSHTTATEIKMEEDALAINEVEKGGATELESNREENAQEPASLCVNKEQPHSHSAMEEQGQETDPILDTDGVTESVESLDTMNGTHIMDVQDLKEPESRSLDKQETISYPSLVYQTQESHRSPVIVPVTEVDGMFPTNSKARTTDQLTTTDEKHKESSRAPDANVRTEEDALLINAARHAKGLEHGMNDDENVERTENTNAEQQSTLSPALEEEHEDPQTCSDINEANENPETLHKKENDWEVDPVIPSEELHDQSHTAATETKLEEVAIAINGVEKGEATELESNNVENAQPACLCVNKEQSHSPAALEEQDDNSDPAPATTAVKEIAENLPTVDETTTAVQTEKHHEESKITTLTDFTGNNAQTAELMVGMAKQDNESSIAPATDARKVDNGVEHESDNGKNTEKTETRGADEQPSTLSSALEEQSSLYINAAIEVPKTLYTWDNASEADLILATKELPKHLDTTSDREIEVDVTASNEVAERKVVEEKGNEEERAEEPESKYVDKQQSHSPTAMEEQADNSDLAPTINAVQEIAENLPMMDETTTAVQTEYHHRDSNITKDEDVLANNIAVQVTEVTELEHKVVENKKKNENADADAQQCLSSAVLKENCDKIDTTQVTKTAPEAVETFADEQQKFSSSVPEECGETDTTEATNSTPEAVKTFADEQQSISSSVLKENHEETDITQAIVTAQEAVGNFYVEGKSNEEERAEEPESKNVDKHQSHSPTAMEKQVESSDLAPAINAVKEIAENLPMTDETMTAVQTEYHHKDSNITKDEHVLANNFAVMVTEVAELEHEVVENKKRHENADADAQQSLSSLVLKENCDETDTTQVTDTAPEALETFADEQQKFSSSVLEECGETDSTESTNTTPEAVETFADEQQSIPSSEMKENREETDIAQAIVTAQAVENFYVEEKSNEEERAEEPESKYVDKQSHSPTAMEEQVENSDLAPAINAVKEIAENLPMMDETKIAVQTEYHHKDSNITKDEDVLANNIAVKVTEVAELEHKVVENKKKNENADADAQQSLSSPVLKENCDETDTTQVTDTAPEAVETFADEQQKFSSSVLEECGETDTTEATNTTPEAVETFADEQQSISSPVLKENREETDIAQAIVTAQEAVENFYVEGKSNEEERAEEPESKYVHKQQSHSPTAMEEQVENSDLAPPINAVKEIAENLPMMDETTTAVQTEYHHKDSNITKDEDVLANNIAVKVTEVAELEHEVVENKKRHENADADAQQSLSSPVLKENCDETDTTQVTDTAPEAVETFADEQQKFPSSVLEECGETDTTEATNTTPEAVETFADEQQSISSSVLKKNREETDIAQVIVTAQEAVENFSVEEKSNEEERAEEPESDKQQSPSPTAMEEHVESSDLAPAINAVKEIEENLPMMDETMTAVQTEYHHTDSNITKDEDVLANNIAVKVTEVAELEHEVVENKKRHENADADAQQSLSSPVLKENCDATDTTQVTDTAPEAVETFADEQQNFSSLVLEECRETDTTEATNTTPEAVETFADEQQSISSSVLKENREETDIAQVIVTAQEAVENFSVEEKSNEEERAEEPESKYVDKQQSHSPTAMEEHVESSDLAPAINAVKEIAENLPMMDETTTAVQTEYHHTDSNITKDEDVLANNIAVKVTEIAELDHEVVENKKRHENVDADAQQSLSSPVLKENCDETDTTQVTDTAPEAVETFADEQQNFSSSVLEECGETDTTEATNATPEAVETFADEQQSISSSVLKENREETDITQAIVTAQEAVENFYVEEKSSEEERAEKQESKYVDKQQSHSPTAMEEQFESSDLAPAINAVKEIAENLPMMDETTTAVQTEYHHKDSNITKDHVLANNLAVKVTEVAELEHEVVENKKRHENADADAQQSLSSPVLKENCDETDTTQVTDTAPEAVETFADEQQKFSSSGLEECGETDSTESTNSTPEAVDTFADEQQSIPSSVLKENREETAIAQAIVTAQAVENFYVEEKSNEEERAEEPETKYVDKQSHSPTAMDEQVENSDLAPAINAVKEIAENLPMMDETTIAVQTEYHHKDSNITKDEDVLANNIAVKVTEVAELEHEVVENKKKNENADADAQQSPSSPVLKENCDETDTTQVTDTAPEAVETFPDEQQKFSSSVLEECGETDTTEATNTTPEAVETFADEQQRILSSVLKENSEETDIAQAIVTAQEAVENFSVEEKSNEEERAEEPQSKYVDKQQSHLPTAMEEQVENSDLAPAINAVKEIAENLPMMDETTTAVQTEYHHKDSNITKDEDVLADNIAVKNTEVAELEHEVVENKKRHENAGADAQQSLSSPVLKENIDETDTTQVTDTTPEAVETFDDEQQKFSSSVLEECGETDTTEATNTTPEAVETFTDEQQSISSSVLKENREETDIAQVIVTAQEVVENFSVEEKSNEEERAEEPESKYVDKQQSHSPTAMEEHVESSDLAPAINAVKEIAENLPMMDETTTAVQTEYHHTDSNITKDEDVLANNIAVKVTEVAELEHEVVENKKRHENADADAQQSLSSPVLKANCDETVTYTTPEAVETFADEQQNFSSSVLEECRETDTTEATNTTPEAVDTFADEQQGISSSVLKENREEADITQAIVTAQEAVGNFYVEEKSNEEERAEEPESKYVDKQQSHSPTAMEEQVESSDLAPAINPVKEIAENLPMMDETTTTVQTEYHHKDSNITKDEDVLANNLAVKVTEVAELGHEVVENKKRHENADADAQQSLSSPVLKENCDETDTTQVTDTATEAVETFANGQQKFSSSVLEECGEADTTEATNTTPEVVDTFADEQQSSSSSALKENCEETDIAQVIITAQEAVENFSVEEKSNEEDRAEEPESKYVDNQQSHSPTAMEEQVENSDLAPAINAVTEIAENLPMMDETTTAVQTEYHHTDSNITKDEDVLANNIAVKVTEVAELEHEVVENKKRHENEDADAQQSLSSPVLKENCDETDTTQVTDTALEAVETFADEQQKFSSSVLEECGETDTTEANNTTPEAVETFVDEQQSISSSVLKENREETDIAQAIVTAQEAVENFYVEEKSNEEERAEEPESKYVDKQQSHSHTAMEEQVENSDLAPAINAVKEIAENLTMMDETTIAVQTEYHHKDSNITKDEDVLANNIAVKVTEVAELEHEVVENKKKHENEDADAQESLSSPVLKENCDETDTTQVTDTVPEEECGETDTTEAINTTPEAVETFVDEQQIISSSVLKENREEADIAQAIVTAQEAVDNFYVKEKSNEEERAEEPESKYVDKQQSHSPTAMEEQVENSDLAPAINAVKEIAENLTMMDETTIAVQTEYHHKDSNITKDEDVLANNIAVKVTEVAELEHKVVENKKKHENADADAQESLSSPVLKENCDETETTQVTDTAPEAVETFADEQQKSSSSVLEECGDTDTTEAINTTPEAVETFVDEQQSTSFSVLKENREEADIAQATVTAQEAVDKFYVEEKSNEEERAEEPESKYVDKQQSHSPTAMEEQVENSDLAPAINAVKEIAEILPMMDETTIAVQTEYHHKDSNITKDEDVLANNIAVKVTQVAELEHEVVENKNRYENADADAQESLSSPVLKENCDETDTTQVTDKAPEAVETFADEQQNFSSSVLEECGETDTTEATNTTPEAVETFADEQQSIPSSVLKENPEETGIAQVIVTAQEAVENFYVEEKSNEEERAEEPESKCVDKQQSHSPTAMEEQVENSDLAPAINAVKEIAENLPMMDETTTAVQTEYHHKDSNITKDEDVLANNIAVKVTEVAELEHEVVENKNRHENADADAQQSLSSPVLKENCDETETTQVTDTAPEAVETFADEQQNFSSSVLEECGETDTTEATNTTPEAVETFADEQQSISSSVLKENREETHIAQAIVTAQEAVEKFYVEEKSNEEERAEEPESKCVDKQQSHSPTAMEEQVENSDLAPTINAVKEIAENLPMMDETTIAVQTEYHHKDSNITKDEDVLASNIAVKVTDVAELEQKVVENKKKHENADADAQQILSSPVLKENCDETDTTQVTDTAPEAVETYADEKQNFSSSVLEECGETDTTEATITTPEAVETFAAEQQSTSSSVLKENREETHIAQAIVTAQEAVEHFYVEEKSNEEERAEEPESKYVDKQSHSPTAMEEQVENSDLAPASNAVKEIAENLPMMDETTIAVQTEYHHKDSNITKDEDVLANNIAVKVTEVAELEHKVVENKKKHENADADAQQSLSSLVLKENCDETDTTQVTDTAPEAIETFADEQQKFSSSVLEECGETNTTEATNTTPEAVETFADEQQSISSSVLKENREETDIAQAIVTTQEAVENFDTNDNEMVTKETMEVKEPHKEINMTLITNATEADFEDKKNHENVDSNGQQSVSSPVLEENSEETDTTEATDTTPEAVAFDDDQQKFSSSVLEECVETDKTEATDPEPEVVETFAYKQQSISSSVLKEDCEETDIAQATDTAPEVAENFYVNENAMVAEETMAVKEPHKELNMTPITNATTEAGVEDEKKHKNADADEWQSVSSPFFKENFEETDTTQATNTAEEAVETFADEQQSFSSSVLIECEVTNTSEDTDTAPEAVETFADEQESISSSILKENCEETNIIQDTDTAPEIAENFYTNDNAMVAKQTMAVKEPHTEFNMTLITNATTDADVPTMDEVKENAKVQELEISSDEIIKEPEGRCFDLQKSFLSSALEKEHEESHTSLVNSGSTEIVGILPIKIDAQTADLMMSAEEQYEQSNKAPATDVTIEADSLLIDAVPEDGYVGHESSNVENEKEMITTVPHEQQSTLSPASDATIEDLEDIHHIKILSKGAQSVGCATKNIDIAECPDTDASKQQTASFPTSKENCEESDIVQPSNATTQSVDNFDSRNIAETADPTVPREEKEKEPNNTPTAEETRDNDLTMGKITEDIEVGGLESSDVENLEEIDNTGAEQQHKVLSSALEAETQASFPPRNAATEIVEALPTENDAKKAGLTVQPEECQKESESTLMTNAPRHTGTFVVDAVLDDKVVEQESNNSQNVEEGESTNVHKQQPYLSPVREECHEESEKMSDTNALTEIAQTHYTRDKAQITDPIAISEEVREASHIAPATNPKTAIDDLGINSMTVGEAVKLKGSNLENAEEPENEIADEQQRISSKALEEKFGYSSTAKLTIATMEIDATTGTRNNAQTEEMGGPTENFDITEKNTEAEVLPVDRITEDVTVGIIRSTTVEIAEANRMDVNQLSVMCQDVEEHLAASVAVSVHCKIKETADALLIRENTWTIDETVPIQEKHEKTVISPATNETTEA